MSQTKTVTNRTEKIRTPADILAEFDRQGITIAGWARAHQVNRSTVWNVLGGRSKGRYGHAHKVAVLLGLKEGTA